MTKQNYILEKYAYFGTMFGMICDISVCGLQA